MIVDVALPWHRYALIGALAQELEGRSPGVFGKTHVQKLVYFLQELFETDGGYEFTMYTYGPFSASLMADLDVADGLEVIRLDYLPKAGAYNIVPGPKLQKAQSRAADFLRQHADAIQKVVRLFGDLRAKDLELRATILFVDRDARRRDAPLDREHLVSRVQAIKPHFSREQVDQAVLEMREHKFVIQA
jgi:uncharacterized protein